MSDLASRSIRFTYTNYRGETAERWVTPLGVRWGSTDWHPEPQWLIRAFDHDKGAEREFALMDCAFAPNITARVKALEAAGNWLSFAAQTSGGTAGLDKELVAAVGAWNALKQETNDD